MRHEKVTVTQGNWGVSCTTGGNINGAILHVYKFHGDRWQLQQKGDGDGRQFPSREAAFAWALEHGYLEVHVRGPWCRDCRQQHTFLGHRSGFCDKLEKFV